MSPGLSHSAANATTQKSATSTTYQTGVDSARQKKADHSKATKKIRLSNGGRTLEEGIKGMKNGTDMVVLYKPAK
ncbi:uncharacterized protein EAF01_002218 [Botrytis porri]|uniref:Uncharacterized protein n=1 Tax=Botrytis porri TaxID=87229 RepID=A0A4Z1KST4_9HELO|nr:uncharacterized protein EAF01_002218 [Botrytis porri]KAF7910708.1 hypothetical protein EAF01_002218 [Botrytis porri]TGO86409.1 hypothetical protein BPOR_0306g00070 [Botrytis porri]